MCRKATIRAGLPALALAIAGAAWGQVRTDAVADWRHVGNAAFDVGLGSVATGAVARVWYSAAGDRLLVAASGREFATADFEQWSAAADPVPANSIATLASSLPESGAQIREAPTETTRLYAFRRNAWRSDDGGAHWVNLTNFRGASLVGGDIADLAVSPRDADEISLATATGVWRSIDGGASWSGLNQFLPNLPAFRILATPGGVRGLRIGLTATPAEFEWAPGEKTGWKPLAQPLQLLAEAETRRALSQALRTTVSAAAAAGDYVYAGGADGRLWASSDNGRTWRTFGNGEEAGAVTAIFVDAREPRIAISVNGAKNFAAARAIHVRKTMNAGIFWDDITANLPDAAVNGVAADHAGAVYVASDAGVFVTATELSSAATPTAWTRIGETLPAGAVSDVKLDAAGNQLYVAITGYGVYATLAPHRLRDPQVVSAADYVARAAAPGSLLTVVGAHVTQASAANAVAPVLAANRAESQIQVPFDARGDSLLLNLQTSGAALDRTVPLQPAAPAVFVDSEGAPLILDADSGLLLDAMHPARSRSRIQILTTGLGRVTPDWPAGVAAPADNPPHVNASVRVLLDRQPLQVTRAVLAPGYVGMYLVEVEVPAVVNAGPSELYVEAGNQSSNRVRVYVEP